MNDLIEQRLALLDQAEALVTLAEEENRDLTDAEQTEYEEFLSQAETLRTRIERASQIHEARSQNVATPTTPVHTRTDPQGQAPGQKQVSGVGDDEQEESRAYCHFIRTGQANSYTPQVGVEQRASNDTDMNIGTAADGGNAVPTGHFQGIIARRDESMISQRLGVRNIPGVGTTVNVPIDNEDDGEFIVTTEAASTDRDAPALGSVAMTLLMYTKRVELSWQLMNDEDSRLMEFLNDFVGRGMAKTHNNLLVTEAGTGGTSLKTFASATAIAAGELEDIVGNDALDPYLDDTASVAWITRNSTLWTLRKLTGDSSYYGPRDSGQAGGNLLGFPVAKSVKTEAIATGNKSIIFGNFNYMGKRDGIQFEVIRDPYSKAANGQIVLHYYFYTVYKTLQAEAIGYGEQA